MCLIAFIGIIIVYGNEKKTEKELKSFSDRQTDMEKLYYGDVDISGEQGRFLHELEKRRKIIEAYVENPDKSLIELIFEYEQKKASVLGVELEMFHDKKSDEYVRQISEEAYKNKDYEVLHDIISLCLNLMDNALEATMRLEEKSSDDKVYFCLGENPYTSGLMINVKNPVSDENAVIKFINSRESSKNNKNIHGYGLKVIDGILEKYECETVKQEVSDGIYDFRIFIQFMKA